jgi:2-C-methyl-D-erythritol 4-phosphate cytidylyltransferase
MFETKILINAIEQALVDEIIITDESSAIEYLGLPSLLVEGSSENIKITRPEDLALAMFYLGKNNKDNLCV